MTLQEAETRLSELNEKICILLKERDGVLEEWSRAFYSENPENTICVDESESEGDFHDLYLVNGSIKMQACYFGSKELNSSLDDFYKALDNCMNMLNVASGRKDDVPDRHKELIYAKAIEIREDYQKKRGNP